MPTHLLPPNLSGLMRSILHCTYLSIKAKQEYEFTFLSRGSVFPPGCWINESYKSYCFTEQLPYSAWEITRVFETRVFDTFVNDSVHSTKWAPTIRMNGFCLLMWDLIAVSSPAFWGNISWWGPDHSDLLHKIILLIMRRGFWEWQSNGMLKQQMWETLGLSKHEWET